MTDEDDSIILGKTVFGDSNQERKSWSCMKQACSRYLVLFLSQLVVVSLIIFGSFWRIIIQKLVTNQPVGWEFCVVQPDTFDFHKDYEQVIFHKKSCLYTVGRSVRDVKVTAYLQVAQNWNFSNKI